MLTAKKAKIKTQRHTKRQQREEWSEIKSLIKGAISLGSHSITTCQISHQSTLRKLEKLGYTFESIGSYLRIKWD